MDSDILGNYGANQLIRFNMNIYLSEQFLFLACPVGS